MMETVALMLFDIGAVQLGRFTLHSGQISPIYLDLRLLVSFPQALKAVAEVYRPVLAQLTFDVLAAYPYAGLPIGTAIALDMNLPLVYPRKTAKQYGTGKQVEGVWQAGQRAVIIEDLVTSGDSIFQAASALKAVGLQVTDAVVLIDREQGGRQRLAEQGYQLYSVMTLNQLLSVLEKHGRITNKQRVQVLAELV